MFQLKNNKQEMLRDGLSLIDRYQGTEAFRNLSLFCQSIEHEMVLLNQHGIAFPFQQQIASGCFSN
ncbi:hypothetical protein A3197_18700 [Candidatus Thiodiazotropha endoloripes]|nr:hypothetical protein A3197_18700 [Candidatus Thiodiazotropha endoloripes]